MTDIELINRVKTSQDSGALTELIERHSGMYCRMVNRYAAIERSEYGFSQKIDPVELRDDKSYNMYQLVLKYDPDKGMKFSTYVGEMMKYKCLDILSDTKVLSDNLSKVEITEEAALPMRAEGAASEPTDSTFEAIKARTKSVRDPRFWSIFKLRHFSDKIPSWRFIADNVGVTHEGARQIYRRNIKHIKYYLIK